MGSGETAPTMKNPHREIFDRFDGDVRALMLDTPFGFQENAPILAEKSLEYFRDTIGRTVDVAGLTRNDPNDVVGLEQAVTRIRDAQWVFAGPGSPTYTLDQWRGTPVADALAEKLRTGGAVVFSSAAALTLGVATVPVYEIYKVGMDPFWAEGLDLLSPLGLNVAVIPHYNNTEGGNHDTNFCYLGERRLAMLEPELPDGAFVLGLDEHTGVIMDLDADTAEIVGKGVLTLRRNGESVGIESGDTVPIDLLRNGGDGAASAGVAASQAVAPGATSESPAATPAAELSLAGLAAATEERFDAAIEARDADAAISAVLELEAGIVEWSRDTLQSDDVDRARAALRSMIVKLGAAATDGVRDPREVLGPLMNVVLEARSVARTEKAWAVADALRDGLNEAGIEVRDTPDGVEWLITPVGA